MSEQPVAIVTGGGRGIGEATCMALARDGFAVAVVDHDPETAARTADGLTAAGYSALAVTCDVASLGSLTSAVDKVIERLGRMDVLVNNAMWIRYRPTADLDEAEMDRMIGVGLKAPIYGAKIAIAKMTRPGGAIINLASPAADMGVPGAAVYSAVKGGVAALTRSLAVELGPLGIRVNAVSPGATPTPGALEIVAGMEHRKARQDRTVIGRLAEPADIAEGVAFLASERARYVTGHILRVDGGITINGS
jgi:NAD(P)-dependent dehydrogenase (short-subunit alcohol dehydrogenase family)